MKVFVLTQLCGNPAEAYCEGVFLTKEKALDASSKSLLKEKMIGLIPKHTDMS